MRTCTGKSSFSLFFIYIVLYVFAGTVVRAQDATGRIIGNVADPSGAPILGASVTATNTGTKIVQT
ncbi:MAG: hypothetical protein WB607_17025, partial [Candidatus Acidiferrum sp.]